MYSASLAALLQVKILASFLLTPLAISPILLIFFIIILGDNSFNNVRGCNIWPKKELKMTIYSSLKNGLKVN